VIILLAMVWIAIFTIGLVELGNYLWARRREVQVDDEEVEHGEGSVRLDDLKPVPFTVVFPSERLRSSSEIEHDDEYLVSDFSDSDLSSASDSDEGRQLS
jgi:hypothetical protein